MISTFLKTIFPEFSDDEYIEIREWTNHKKHFIKDPEEAEKFYNMNDVGFGVFTRRGRHSRRSDGAIGRTSVLWLDIDITDVDEDMNEMMRNEIIDCIKNDYLLSQYMYIISSGRGLHIYYRLPYTYDEVGGEQALKNLFKYASTFAILKPHIDERVLDVSRIMRLPGTINSKNYNMCSILEHNDITVDDAFMAIIKGHMKEHKPASLSSSEAFTLLGMSHLADGTKNHRCPFHDLHGTADNKPSFRYYPETDTYWCFKCRENGGWHGGHFLKNMGRTDLVAQIKSKYDVPLSQQYTLLSDGTLVKKNAKTGEMRVIAKFLSSTVIEYEDDIFGRQQYIYFPDNTTVRIDDLPSNRVIKRRYYETGRSFVLEAEHQTFAEHLTRYAMMATKKRDIRLVTQYGINGEDYYFNGRLWPKNVEFIRTFVDNRIEFNHVDINRILQLLVDDNNITHIIAILWGVATTVRDIIIRQCNMFPLLISTGARGSGKTNLGKLVLSMFGRHLSETLNTTNFALLEMLQRSGSYPIHFDEYGKKQLEVDAEERIKGLAVQYPYVEQRGNQDKTIERYCITAPVIITGEKHIRDSGLIQRSLMLNVTRNYHSSNKYFNEWMKAVKDYSLMSFMCQFLSGYHEYRQYMRNNVHEYDRHSLIIEIITKTYNYLVDNNLIDGSIVSLKDILTVLQVNESTKDVVICGEYPELFEMLSVFRPDPSSLGNPIWLNELLDSIFFYDRYVILNPMGLHKSLMFISPSSRQFIPSSRTLKTILAQSPSFRGTLNGVYIHGKQYANLYVLTIDNDNFIFFREILKLKLPEDKQHMLDDIMYYMLNNRPDEELNGIVSADVL